MAKLKNFAEKRPFLFGLVLVFIYALLGTLTFPVHYLFPESELGQVFGDALGKFIIFLLFLWMTWRFGWIKASGFTSSGTVKMWGIVVIILFYKTAVELYAFTGSFSLPISDVPLSIATLLLSLCTGLVEETIFRVLALVAMVSAWGDTKNGLIKAIILSSTFFGIIHMFNILVRPAGVVLFQALVAILPGIWYASFILTHKSVWPAIIVHGLTNAVVNIKLIGYEGYQESITMWVIFAAALIPLMVYSAYLIRELPVPYELVDQTQPES
jgi:membrane protease YdiL (CAAX protease family)